MTRYEFPLPDPGEGLTEAEIAEWHVEEGEEVEEDDVLAEIETDKAVTELPAPCPGTIEGLAASVGDVVDVGATVVVFETDDPPSGAEAEGDGAEADEEAEEAEGDEAAEEETEDEEDEADREAEQEAAEATAEADAGGAAAESKGTEATGEPETEDERVFAAPRTRRYARDEGVSLVEVDGSGPDGRVLQEDIDAFLSGDGEAEAAGAEAAGGEGGDVQEGLHPSVAIEPTSIGEDEERSTRRDLSGLRARIAENMAHSANVIPHVTSGFEADAEAFVALRERLNEKHDARITYTPLLVKAVVPALQAFPLVNASLDDETGEIVEKHYYNVGFATHTEDGLIVPVIKDVDSKSIVEIAEELSSLAAQARDRSIDMADLQGGTFTVTNLAADGAHRTHGSPIINHPEAAITGVGRIHKAPVVTDDEEIEIRQRLPLSLTFDHRLIDGVTGNRFMEHLIEGVEDPDVLLSRL
jgi:pyruvate dehydrogenase E2 component (dihydrolipoamide acetyltransferase)